MEDTKTYPSTRYHKTHGQKDGLEPRIVDSPEHEEEVAPESEGWAPSPADHGIETAPAAGYNKPVRRQTTKK